MTIRKLPRKVVDIGIEGCRRGARQKCDPFQSPVQQKNPNEIEQQGRRNESPNGSFWSKAFRRETDTNVPDEHFHSYERNRDAK